MSENSFLIPLLEKYYPDEDSFNKQFEHLIKKAEDIYLDKELGLSINITNIAAGKETKSLISALENNQKFTPILKSGFDIIDEGLFERGTEFSFEKYIFKSGEINSTIKDKNGRDVSFRLFVNISCTNLSYHIISFTFTTWDTRQEYIKLSNSQIIDLASGELNRIRNDVLLFEQNRDIGKIIEMDTNPFISFQFWIDDWKSSDDNLLDAREYIKNHPHYFYSLINLDNNVFERHYKNIMDILGQGFSTSRAYIEAFSQNAFLEITIKPINERFETIGHDASMFKVWEMLALQRRLLFEINKTGLKNAEQLIREIDKVYDFNKFVQKKGKGVPWIKLTRYLQYITRIDFDYELYKVRIEKKKKEELEKDSLRLQRLNILIIATIFVSISTFLLSECPIELTASSFAHFTTIPLYIQILLATIGISMIITIFVVLFFLYSGVERIFKIKNER